MQVVPPGGRLQRVLGTGSYMAPEVLAAAGYDERADLWSAGVILFVLLCGFPPYEATYGSGDALDARGTLQLVEAQCVRGAWDSFPSPHWDAVSCGATALVRLLLQLSPARRPQAAARPPRADPPRTHARTRPCQRALAPTGAGPPPSRQAHGVLDHEWLSHAPASEPAGARGA
jgi:serine/threonine protein kinase